MDSKHTGVTRAVDHLLYGKVYKLVAREEPLRLDVARRAELGAGPAPSLPNPCRRLVGIARRGDRTPLQPRERGGGRARESERESERKRKRKREKGVARVLGCGWGWGWDLRAKKLPFFLFFSKLTLKSGTYAATREQEQEREKERVSPSCAGFCLLLPAPGTSTVDSTVDRFLSPRPIKIHLSMRKSACACAA